MQYSVYLKGQPLSFPNPAHASRRWALAAVAGGFAVVCAQHAIQLRTPMSWKDARSYLRRESTGQPHPINPANYHVLPYLYPLSYDILRCYQRHVD